MDLRDYAVGDVVYSGSETRVCLAVHRPSGTRVALKMLVADVPSPRAAGRLVHEHQVLTQLAAVPGVVRIRALEWYGSAPVLVFEDSGLRPLDKVLAERGRLPVAVGLGVARQVARVLSGVHAAGVMHKDIKPQNILVDEGWEQVILLDFDIASWLSEETTAPSLPEALEGTLSYISPEQTGRTARALDARTDLYSLGVTLFEMLSGRLPFTERDPLALVHAHLAKEPPALGEVAPAVAAVVAKLLAKDPEQRYQTAKGVAEDLEECLRRQREREPVERFALGQRDFSPRLRLPQVLVGRQHEVEQVGASFARAALGAVELLVIGGPSGIGKTALVRTVYRDIAREGRGTLIAGKHDQLGRATPYAAMAQAFGGLMRQWLASPEPQVLQGWQERLRKALGANARLIADVVPELALVMGELAAAAEVGPEESLNRLKLTWLSFVRAVISASPPLVLFVDDLQWADSATLALLQTLLTDVERGSLLVIGAYRDNEVDASHGLWKLCEQVEQSGACVSRLAVGPLAIESVCAWLRAALETDDERVMPLSRVLWDKTRGNPFFLGQLLLTLHGKKLVTRDLESGGWQWDQARIEAAPITDNVVELMAAKVRELPEATQRVLGLAACSGHTVALPDLVVLADATPAEVTRALSPALHTGLLVPVGGAYRDAHALSSVEVETSGPVDATYRFLHDRVQQASYEQIAEEERAAAHAEIGRRLRTRYEAQGGTAQALFDVVRHLNLGAAKLEREGERVELARLNLSAARMAKHAGAYGLMANLLDTAEGLLLPAAWENEPRSMAEVSVERIEAAYFLRAFDEVEARAQAVLSRPLPSLLRWTVSEIRLRTCLTNGQFARGVELGREIFREAGVAIPTTDEAVNAEFIQLATELDRWMEVHGEEGFDRMQPMSDVERILQDNAWTRICTCAAVAGRPVMAGWIAAKRVQEMTLRGELTPAFPFWMSSYPQCWSAAFGTYRRAARWTVAGYRALGRMASPMAGECCFMVAAYFPYSHPVDHAREYHEQAITRGLEQGSHQAVSWGTFSLIVNTMAWRGAPLPILMREVEERRGLMLRAGDASGRDVVEVAESWGECLSSEQPPRLDEGGEPLKSGSREMLRRGDGHAGAFGRIFEAHVYLVFGEPLRVLARAREAEQFRSHSYGYPPVTDIPLWLALTSAKRLGDAGVSDEERSTCVKDLEHGISRFQYFAEGCAENFLHKLRLIEAEHARVHGRIEEAMAKYDEAIELAGEQRFLHIEALAAQLCAEFHLGAGRPHLAGHYLREASGAYAHWGARAVITHLEAKYPALLKASVRAVTTERAAVPITTTTRDSTTGSAQLDVGTAVRAAQALSGELDPKRVVGRLMELLLENAGAERGVLVLHERDVLTVVARLSVEGSRIETGLSEPLGQSREVAATVVQYVARTRESVVVDDAQTDARFAADPYLALRKVRSLIALPLTHQGRLSGVLCLEHGSAPSAFPPARVALLSVLASQAAIAVENAQLYGDLEAKVALRTAELRTAKEAADAAKEVADAANQAKSDFLASMSHELRTPLNGILGYAQVLSRLSDMPPKGRDGVRVIQRSGEHLLLLINDVLDLAKVEAGKMELYPKDFHFPSFLHTVTNISSVRAEQKRISFGSEQTGPALQTVHADDKRLLQVLLNLLGNAIKFTERGGVTLRVLVEDEADVRGERQVRFQIADTGPGIESAHLERIFLPFEQVGSRTARAEGTGLGLSICSKIVALMGGSLRVESQVEKGSLFEMTLRLRQGASAGEAASVAAGNEIVGYEGKRRRILVVDDKEDNRAVLRDLLTPLGFEVGDAASGEEALEVALEYKPELVVMDLAMPGMDGYEATRRLLSTPELFGAVVIASSASLAQGAHDGSAEAGCRDFLPKPVQVEQLLEMVGRHLSLSWIRRRGPGDVARVEGLAEGVLAPPLEDLTALLSAVSRGRLRAVQEEGDRIEQQDARFGPWVRQLRALAQSYQIKQLREFIQLHAERSRSHR